MIAAIALCLASCTDNKENIPTAVKSGDEVAFSVSMPAKTRTVYGNLGTTTRPVYWKDGDLIEVASPQCMEGRNVAQYKVNTEGTENLNYAKSLDRTGAYGVQWGEAAATDCKFYAVYPSSEMTINGSSVVANLSIASTQIVTLKKNDTGETTAYEPESEDMVNNIMYAQPLAGQTQVVVDEATGNTTANLQFQPYSTVLHFNMKGWNLKSTVGQRNMVIYSVAVTANNAIAGDFDLTLKDDASEPTVGTATNTSNTITVEFKSGELRGVDIDPNVPFSFDMFLLPNAGMSVDENWTITVNTSAGKWTKNLKNGSTANKLTPGSIHVLPQLPAFSVENSWEYNPSEWIKDLDDKIYFTEISLPGSWYSASNKTDMGSDYTDIYQNDGIETQFDAGVRAFYLETRVGGTSYWFSGSTSSATVVISGSGDNSTLGLYDYYRSATSISQSIISIAKKVRNTKEFVVLTLGYTDKTGGLGGTNAKWRALWIPKIKDVLAEPEVATALNDVLYTNKINSETTVDDLRGKLILKINIDDMYESSEIANVDESEFAAIPALFSFTTYNWADNSLVSTLTWQGKPIMENTSISSSRNSFYWNYTVANRTYSNSDTPTLENRKTAISYIIQNSYSAHRAGKNNLWGMVGAGGSMFSGSSATSGGDPSSVSDGDNGMNRYLSNEINKKVTSGEASPMGMVFVNFATGAEGKELIEAIIRMNSRFELGRKNTDDTPSTVQSAKEGYSSGFNVDTENWKAF